MRILFLTAFYPPYIIGGWEQLVQDIRQRLEARGHVTQVLTSRYGISEGIPDTEAEQGVFRILNLESDLYHYQPLDYFFRRRDRLDQDLQAARSSIEQFCPDIIFIHGMWNLSRAFAWLAESILPERVVYYIANNWPYAPNVHTAYWQDSARRLPQRLLKSLLAPAALGQVRRDQETFSLRFERVLCVSDAMRRELASEAGIPFERMRVLYNGVETDVFTPVERNRGPGELALLYAGNINSHKGVHTAVKAMARLAHRVGMEGVSLSLAGSGHPGYLAHLRQIAGEAGLEGRVHFLGQVERKAMPELLRKFDVLVFPSVWQEPLARMTQEAMAAGVVVVGTLTGGTPEILIPEETGLSFQPEDDTGLAEQLERLVRDPNLWEHLRVNARQLVLEKFDLERMVDEIEDYLTLTVKADEAAVPDEPVSPIK